MPLGPMEAFVTAARLRSLTAAAAAMALSLPALSRRIRQLEAELGVRLFEREPRGIRLTEAGRDYIAALGPAWDAMQAATEAVRHRDGGHPLRVTVLPSFAASWLVPRLARLQDRPGAVPVELHSEAEPLDLSARPDLDCAIRLGAGPWPGLRGEAFLPVRAFPVASPEAVRDMPVLQGPRDLLGQRLIGTHHQPAFWREWFAAAGMEASPPGWRSFDTLHLVYEAAAAGMGVALGIEPIVRPFIEAGRLVPVLPEVLPLPRHFHLLRRASAPADFRFTQFRDWLRREAAVSLAGS